jgi:hypothetical protein
MTQMRVFLPAEMRGESDSRCIFTGCNVVLIQMNVA